MRSSTRGSEQDDVSSARTDDGSHPGPLLTATGLQVEFPSSAGWIRVVEDLTIDIGVGETVGLVGESGSGKTVGSLALLGLVPELGGRVPAGSVQFDGRDLLALDQRAWDRVRGAEIAMIFQQPTRSLNPAFRVGDQIAETVRRHLRLSRKASWARAVEMLDRVKIPDAARRAREYAHEFSGGQAQRIMIAMALACEPRLLVADEPTTALDATVERHILDLLRELQRDTGIAVLLISHDLAVVSETCERVVVMYAGEVIELARADEIVHAPRHPYTCGLIRSIPDARAGRRLHAMAGTVPSFDDLPTGCRFHPRCAISLAGVCDHEPIELLEVGSGPRLSRCARVDVVEGSAPL